MKKILFILLAEFIGISSYGQIIDNTDIKQGEKFTSNYVSRYWFSRDYKTT